MTQEPDTTIWIAEHQPAWNTSGACDRLGSAMRRTPTVSLVTAGRPTGHYRWLYGWRDSVWSTTSSSHPEAGPMPGGSTTG